MARFIFLASDGAEVSLDPDNAAASARIRAIAAHFRARLPAGCAVGLLYRTEPDLVIAWFAALVAGLRPLVMQYPTRKQSRAYWLDSVRNTVATAGLAGIVADNYCASLDLAQFPNPIAQAELDCLPDAAPDAISPDRLVLPDDFTIIQLSSGTTGYRKAMEFTRAALVRHVADYNEVLGLTASDRIVSWLPLYHDMGYIACFVMPILLGIDVVMMDPMDWVKQPELLVTAIERHQATTCYMPNFGFELMARSGMPPLPGMRRWISCSEPVSAATAEKFLRASGAPAEIFRPCYAMAENIFAVTIGVGCRIAEIDGASVVSCGKPIPGVEIKIVEGEIWARSPTSLVRYMGADDIRDPDGYYPTGDLGQFVDGELHVSGRKQDLLIQAGKKFVLSDIDLRLNELRPAVRGRAAAIAVLDERLGTEMPTVLIEALDFFERTDATEIATELKDATGLDQVEVAFVPPRFLTKTSSGKFNRRKSRADWIAAREAQKRSGVIDRDPVSEIRASFEHAGWDAPVGETLDSLSLTVLRIILDATHVRYQAKLTLNEIVAALQNAPTTKPSTDDGIRIVSLADEFFRTRFTKEHLARLEVEFGCPVSFEHVCLPPSPLLLSDLVFHDYFQPRLEQEAFSAVSRAMAKLRKASLIITDSAAEMLYLYNQTYTTLSHNLERSPRADLISLRWPDYIRNHHLLPLTVVAGYDIPLEASTATLGKLERYLGVPIFKVATLTSFAPFTSGWDYHPNPVSLAAVDTDKMLDHLLEWVKSLSRPLPKRALEPGSRLVVSDMAHFCSHEFSKVAIEKVIDRFDSFCIAGQAASAPYVEKAIERHGKRHIRVPSFAKEVLDGLSDRFECLLICGAIGTPNTEKPVVAVQHISQAASKLNLGTFGNEIGEINVRGPSNTDWFYDFVFEGNRDVEHRLAARHEVRQFKLPRQNGIAQKEARVPRQAPAKIQLVDRGQSFEIVRLVKPVSSMAAKRVQLGTIDKQASHLGPEVMNAASPEEQRVITAQMEKSRQIHEIIENGTEWELLDILAKASRKLEQTIKGQRRENLLTLLERAADRVRGTTPQKPSMPPPAAKRTETIHARADDGD
jgi:acyl-CoA synthetase (AMP-forming)/AMP-acid ligase II